MRGKNLIVIFALIFFVLLAGCSGTGDTGKWDRQADLVVIGAGAAGMAAAVEAADQGVKNIILLEKMSFIGGTAILSHGLLAGYETQVTKANDVHDTEKALYDLINANAEYRLDPEMIGITVNKSGETIDWLIDRVKVPFVPTSGRGYGSQTMMHTVVDRGSGLREPFGRALDEAGVDIMLETRAVKLIQDDRDAVIGVEATNAGKTLRIKAKAVIIATGGYSANDRLAEVLDPFYRNILQTGVVSSTGDGLIMGSNAGAGISNIRLLSLDYKDYEIITQHNGDSGAANANRVMSAPSVIYLNTQGKRFVDEKNVGFMFQRLGESFFREMHRNDSEYLWGVIDQETYTAVKAERALGLEYISGNSPRDLAGKMGVDPAALEKTISDYNLMAAVGRDVDFNRDPATMKPLTGKLYAVKFAPTLGITYGGLIRNDKAQVLRLDETVIPGLYCAGEVSANFAYMGFTLSGCFTWGRIAGAAAAEFIGK